MSSPVLTQSTTVQCPHGGSASVTPSNQMAKADGSPILTVADIHQVVGCPFTLPSGTPNPCALIQWQAPAVQAKVNQIPVLLENSVGLCIGPTGPQGTAQIVSNQSKVKAS